MLCVTTRASRTRWVLIPMMVHRSQATVKGRWTGVTSYDPSLAQSAFPHHKTRSRVAEKAANKRLPESQETAHTSAPQHHNTVTYLLNGGIHYVKLGVLLNLRTTCYIQFCWLVAQIPYRSFFLQHERRGRHNNSRMERKIAITMQKITVWNVRVLSMYKS